MKKVTGFVLGLFAAAVLGFGALAVAQTYYGFNPSTGLEVLHGVLADGGVAPVVSGSCGTRGTTVLGAYSGTIIGGAVTTCTTTLTFASAAPRQYTCFFFDVTTPADPIGVGTGSTTACSSNAATVVSGDKIAYLVVAQ